MLVTVPPQFTAGERQVQVDLCPVLGPACGRGGPIDHELFRSAAVDEKRSAVAILPDGEGPLDRVPQTVVAGPLGDDGSGHIPDARELARVRAAARARGVGPASHQGKRDCHGKREN